MPFKCWFYVCVECVVRVSSNYSYVLFEDHSSQIPLFLLEPAKLTWGWMFLFFNSDPSWWAHPQNVPILFLFEIYIIYQMKLIFMRTNFWEKIFKLFFFLFSQELIFSEKPAPLILRELYLVNLRYFIRCCMRLKKGVYRARWLICIIQKLKNFTGIKFPRFRELAVY